MKSKNNPLIKSIFILAISLGSFLSVSAQAPYKVGAGLVVEFGEGGAAVGPGVKYFFAEKHALDAAVLFANGATLLNAFYTYNSPIPGAQGLNWYVGAGPTLAMGGGVSVFGIGTPLGVEFKLPSIPISLSLDWRPKAFIFDGETFVDAVQFGFAARYTF